MAKRTSGKSNMWADHYTRKARAEGFAARSIYKLEEIDKKHRLLRHGMRVLDLGCNPGSWTQYVSSAVGPKGLVIGIDRRDTPPCAANVRTMTADLLTLSALPDDLRANGFDAVLSDLAPDTTGIPDVDEARSLELAEAARRIALANLRPGGFFLVKIFQGPDFTEWVRREALRFDPPQITRPDATRKKSREIFVLLRNFHPSSP